MPNNEQLRFCTGAEVAGFGAAFSEIAERVGDESMVGEILCEDEVRALLRAD
jgi:hypothetical protein